MSVFVVKESGASESANRFEFQISADADVLSVPKLQFLSGETTEYLEDVLPKGYGEARMTRGMLAIECPEGADAIRKLRDDQVLDISRGWYEASAASVGESLASEN